MLDASDTFQRTDNIAKISNGHVAFFGHNSWYHVPPHLVETLRAAQETRREVKFMTDPDCNIHAVDPIYRLAVFLDAFDIRTAYPLLLALLDAKVGTADWEAISATIESYLLRRGVCVMNTKNYNRVFLQLTKNLRRDGISPENLKKLLNAQSGESVEWPSDAAFREAWLNKAAYDLGNAKLVHILTRLNETYVTSKAEPLSFEQQPSVEHLLPRDWIEHWPLPDGLEGMTLSELISAADDDPRAFATEVRNRALQSMGNLTILMQALNSAQSNSAWKDKKPALMKHSLLAINQDLHDVEIWNESAITVRSEKMFERALKIWPREQQIS